MKIEVSNNWKNYKFLLWKLYGCCQHPLWLKYIAQLEKITGEQPNHIKLAIANTGLQLGGQAGKICK